ncbi:uncharacterized protein LOC114333132 [Diabrotica virgifera virgifera]|uniref:Uncharacterized protein LOC114333132 n=1 Tax=Diabrotica virgifera virgifera TaxID=50390 RepID=A0A6P7FVJ5_DIAVI|nr:uncharacterized protein LOC114333132 [Diabrotica virgifera virgifera]
MLIVTNMKSTLVLFLVFLTTSLVSSRKLPISYEGYGNYLTRDELASSLDPKPSRPNLRSLSVPELPTVYQKQLTEESLLKSVKEGLNLELTEESVLSLKAVLRKLDDSPIATAVVCIIYEWGKVCKKV